MKLVALSLAAMLALAACSSSATTTPMVAPTPPPIAATSTPTSAPTAYPTAAPTPTPPGPTAPTRTPTEAPTPSPADTPSPSPTPASTPSQADADLAAAIAYAPAGTTWIGFTDWSRLYGAHPNTATEISTLATLSTTHAIPADQLPRKAAAIRQQWSFGPSDLDWQVDVGATGVGFSVLQFRDTFDMTTITTLLDSRAYTKGTPTAGVQTYSHALDLSAGYEAVGINFMTNVGVDLARRRLIAALGPASLTGAITAAAAEPLELSAGARARLLAGTLGSPYAALLSVDVSACSTFAGGPSLGLATASPAAMASGLAGLAMTIGVGIGIAEPTSGAQALTVALLYPSAAAASADLAPRSAFVGGMVTRDGQPYSSTVMALSNGRAVGSLLVFDGAPAAASSRVVTAFFSRDLPFAACR